MLVIKLLIALLGLGTGTLLWRSRLIQVISFVVAAGLRGQYKGVVAIGPATKNLEWSELPPIAPADGPLNAKILVTYHPEYHGFDPLRAVAALRAIADLNVGWVRTDVRWREIFPDGILVDSQALAWYRSFVRSASASGLKSMVVLSTPPAALMKQNSQRKLAAWNRFVDAVVSELGFACNTFQLMNEPNNPIYSFFSLEDAAAAFVQGATIIRSARPDARVAVNISMDFWGWRRYLAELLRLSGSSIDIVGLDHYPGTWTIAVHERWSQLLELADLFASAGPDSPWSKRTLMIMETGFATNVASRDQDRQSKYFEDVFRVAEKLKRKALRDDILLGVYELCDGESTAWLDPEAHFGLLTTRMEQKAAFLKLREISAAL